ALTLGRNAVGSDVSSLAAFVSAVKSTVYSDRELKTFASWGSSAATSLGGRHACSDQTVRMVVNMSGANTWRLRNAIAQATATTTKLRSPRVQKLARCAIL